MQQAGYMPLTVQWDQLSSEEKQKWLEGWKGREAHTDTGGEAGGSEWRRGGKQILCGPCLA